MPPAPDPNAMRRDRPSDKPWVRLAPRPADAPALEWPLTAPSPRELELWGREWQRPQASEWLKHDEAQAVALFVRLLARAEAPDAPVTLMKYVREFRNELGISADGAARRRWLFPDDKAAPSATVRPATVTPINGGAGRPRTRSSAKDRHRVVPTGQAAVVDDDPPPF